MYGASTIGGANRMLSRRGSHERGADLDWLTFIPHQLEAATLSCAVPGESTTEGFTFHGTNVASSEAIEDAAHLTNAPRAINPCASCGLLPRRSSRSGSSLHHRE